VEGRDLGSRPTHEVIDSREIGVSLTPPPSIFAIEAGAKTEALLLGKLGESAPWLLG
jgi:hypothetical protein